MHDFPELTEALIQEWVGKPAFVRGRTHFSQHRVLSAQMEEDGRLIIGAVKTKDQQSAQQSHSVLIRRLAAARIKSKCTCDKKRDCEHVAAVLHAVLNEQKQRALFEQEAPDEPTPQAFSMWLGMLDKIKAGSPVTTEYPDNIKQRLLYILEADGDKNVQLNFISARILKSGGYGISQPYDAANILTYPSPRYVLAGDEKILREVATDRSLSSMHGYRIKGSEGLNILKRALNTGRCHWRNKDTKALKRTDRRQGEWGWQLNSRGDQHLTLQMADNEIIVPTLSPWYIDTEQAACGPVDSGQPADVAEILLNIAPVELDCSDAAIRSVSRQLPEHVPAPLHLQHVHRQVQPVALIRLKSMSVTQRWG